MTRPLTLKTSANPTVAEYPTVLPPAEVLREKLHQAIETARGARIEAKADDGATEDF